MPAPPVLLLLPGLLCDDRLWRDQTQALGATTHCIVADLTQDDNLASMAARALDAVPADAAISLIGLSMGGYVALEILRRAPARIARLALMDTSARADTPEQSRRRRGLLSLSNSGQFRGVTPRLLPQLLHPSRLDGPLGEEVRAMADRVGRDAFQRQQRAILARPDSRPHLPAIRVPTLVAVGEHDILTPPDLAEEMAALIPGATLARIPDAAHLPPMETPEAVLLLLQAWLADGATPPHPAAI
jgi:pimeloyl-ACP methyl ester carboxylesterase